MYILSHTRGPERFVRQIWQRIFFFFFWGGGGLIDTGREDPITNKVK